MYKNKKEYNKAAREFYIKYKNSGDLFEGAYNTSRGQYAEDIQYILQAEGKTLIISK